MKNYKIISRFLLIILLASMSFIWSCRSEDEEIINYYDFPDAVLKYPIDTSQADSVSIDFDSDGKIDFKAFASYLNVFGIDSHYTNKVASVIAYNTYQIYNQTGCGCAGWTNYNQGISPNDLPVNGHFYPVWREHAYLLFDVYTPSTLCPLGGCGIGEVYLKMRKSFSGPHSAGWMRIYVAGKDSVVFYDCAFGQQPHKSIRAEQTR